LDTRKPGVSAPPDNGVLLFILPRQNQQLYERGNDTMKMNVYSIYDTAAAVYLRPFFMQSDGQALRSFSDIANDAEHDIGRHPEDYTLVRIGDFNDQNGQLIPESPESLITGLEAVAAHRNKVDRHALQEFDDKVTNGEITQ
jgi:hypothetical protein